MAILYILAGLNHFRRPAGYLPLIPDYFGNPVLLNYAAGIFEIIGGIGLLIPATRQIAAYGIIAMLMAFIPSHILMIQQGGCFPKPAFCFPEWTMWVRLLIFQPLLIWWAAKYI